MKAVVVVVLLMTALAMPASAGEVVEAVALKKIAGAVVAEIGTAVVVNPGDVVAFTRSGRSAGEARVLAVHDGRALLAPLGGARPQPGDSVVVSRTAPPVEFPPEPDVPWTMEPPVSVKASYRAHTVPVREGPSTLGFDALWVEGMGEVAVQNRTRAPMRDVVVDVYVNRVRVSRVSLGSLSPGGTASGSWTRYGHELVGVRGAAALNPVLVVRWAGEQGSGVFKSR